MNKISPAHNAAYENDIRFLAEDGDPRAQYAMGYFYASGENGLKPNFREAVKWFQKAANNNYAAAQSELGLAYWLGRGVRKDAEKAAYWLSESAKLGYALSVKRLFILCGDSVNNPDDMLKIANVVLGANFKPAIQNPPVASTTRYEWYQLEKEIRTGFLQRHKIHMPHMSPEETLGMHDRSINQSLRRAVKLVHSKGRRTIKKNSTELVVAAELFLQCTRFNSLQGLLAVRFNRHLHYALR